MLAWLSLASPLPNLPFSPLLSSAVPIVYLPPLPFAASRLRVSLCCAPCPLAPVPLRGFA